MFQAKAMVHSLKAQDDVTILHEKGSNDVVAEYKGVRCTAIFNPFAGMFYVDDIYGVLPDQHKCPSCGEYVA
ncbi:MAG: hypothetical protein NC548_58755 [Lachnospiraceae bacterium]|nr:hypothetical protein [Lachnospiraceae bacterium]